MQRVTLVRYTAKPDRADENEALARAVHKELRATAPSGVTYLLFRNGGDFVHLFVNAKEDAAEALTDLPSFKTYIANILERCAAPPDQTRLSLTLLEAYGLSSAVHIRQQ
jgi:quinol monooxygenase YgiN